MLTRLQKTGLLDQLKPDDPNHRVLRKRILDKSVKAVEDLSIVFQHAEIIPDLKRRLPPEKLEELVNAYFMAFKVSPEFSNPEKVIKLLDEIAVLQRKNAALAQELGDMVHQVEHFKYVATHTTELLEMERAKPEGLGIVAKM
jgi:hypothetical protein